MARESRRPTRDEIAAAHGKRIRDVIADDLAILFCGINPGLYSGATGHHFARPGNRFWKALHGSGLTPGELSPFDDRELLRLRLGVTNLVERSTATADELSPDELRVGARRLERKARRYRPAWIAVVGITAYRIGFARPRAAVGRQQEMLGPSRLWVLPNPSGRTAAYQLPALIEEFSKLRDAAGL